MKPAASEAKAQTHWAAPRERMAAGRRSLRCKQSSHVYIADRTTKTPGPPAGLPFFLARRRGNQRFPSAWLFPNGRRGVKEGGSEREIERGEEEEEEKSQPPPLIFPSCSLLP